MQSFDAKCEDTWIQDKLQERGFEYFLLTDYSEGISRHRVAQSTAINDLMIDNSDVQMVYSTDKCANEK